jgi:hypothetical protein
MPANINEIFWDMDVDGYNTTSDDSDDSFELQQHPLPQTLFYHDDNEDICGDEKIRN